MLAMNLQLMPQCGQRSFYNNIQNVSKKPRWVGHNFLIIGQICIVHNFFRFVGLRDYRFTLELIPLTTLLANACISWYTYIALHGNHGCIINLKFSKHLRAHCIIIIFFNAGIVVHKLHYLVLLWWNCVLR